MDISMIYGYILYFHYYFLKKCTTTQTWDVSRLFLETDKSVRPLVQAELVVCLNAATHCAATPQNMFMQLVVR